MNASTQQSRQAGFTLVELIVVILILGIMSALALPKFISVGTDARAAKVSAIYGSVRAASQMIYAQSLVKNSGANATAATGSVTTQDGTSIATAYGYPDSSTTGIALASGLDPSTTSTSNKDQVTITSASAPTGALTISPNGAATASSCQVSYTPATSATSGPAITMVNSGC